MIKHIRFDKISPHRLSNSVKPSGLLSQDQLYQAHKVQTRYARVAPYNLLESEQTRWQGRLPVWSNTSSQVCTAAQPTKIRDFGVLQCPPITSGAYRWTLEPISLQLGTSNNCCSIALFCGIALHEKVPLLDSKEWLGDQKGVWGFIIGGGNFDPGVQRWSGGTHSEVEMEVAVGARVTLTLDLTNSYNHNRHGYLTASYIRKADGVRVELGLVSNLCGRLLEYPGGFSPIVSARGNTGFRLVDFEKLQDL